MSKMKFDAETMQTNAYRQQQEVEYRGKQIVLKKGGSCNDCIAGTDFNVCEELPYCCCRADGLAGCWIEKEKEKPLPCTCDAYYAGQGRSAANIRQSAIGCGVSLILGVAFLIFAATYRLVEAFLN